MPLVMTPAAGERVLRFVGDRLRFSLRAADGRPLPAGWRALVRTNLGRARTLRHEIIHSYPSRPPLAGAAWHDLALFPRGGEWFREITLAEAGFFRAKAYAVDPQGRQHWPDGPDLGVVVHPDSPRRQHHLLRLRPPVRAGQEFGGRRESDRGRTASPELDRQEIHRHSAHPASCAILRPANCPTSLGRLGCRILHLLPVTPTPTTFARFGRFGSPYAVQDLTAVDPALVEFDRRTTGVDQFRELTYASHQRGGRVFLDIPINHTGWGSTLQENHPEWYLRKTGESSTARAPGA